MEKKSKTTKKTARIVSLVLTLSYFFSAMTLVDPVQGRVRMDRVTGPGSSQVEGFSVPRPVGGGWNKGTSSFP